MWVRLPPSAPPAVCLPARDRHGYRMAKVTTVSHSTDKEAQLFACSDCLANTSGFAPGSISEYYMVHDHLWDAATADLDGRGMLCIGCLERRLGRQLTAADFTDAPINAMPFFPPSARLASRLAA